MLPLQQRKERLMALKPRWSNTFASDLRFESHVQEARKVAECISGREFPWFARIEPPPVAIPDVDDDNIISHNHPDIPETFDPHQTIVEDILMSEDNDEDDVPTPRILWVPPVCCTCSDRQSSPDLDCRRTWCVIPSRTSPRLRMDGFVNNSKLRTAR